MTVRTLHRLRDIVDAVDQIDELLANRTFEDVQANRVVSAALERFLEILSEASRHVPASLKEHHKYRGSESAPSGTIYDMHITGSTHRFSGTSTSMANWRCCVQQSRDSSRR